MTSLRCANAPSSARLFIRLATRTYSTKPAVVASRTLSSPLEFLVPRSAAATLANHAALRTTTTRSGLPSSVTRLVAYSPSVRAREFSTSAPRCATVCVQNPIKDEDGNDMTMEITARAAKRLSQIMAKDQNPNLALRIQVESGGCHGFQYLMSLITIPAKDAPEWSTIVNEDDSIFQYVPEDGEAALPSPEPPRIIMDEPSLELLKGSKVDFTMELIGSQFKIADNPHATSSCGCGTSFDIKG